jgi:ABC-type transport system involved in Fe-S cluster assembly fused permease/ATPase subunit
MRLLYRFYDVTEGSIKVNGLDIRDASQTSLRRAIGLVPQGERFLPRSDEQKLTLRFFSRVRTFQ